MLKNNSGFTLIEVLIASTIFFVFITFYTISEGRNKTDSMQIKRETMLENIANQVINETIASPPDFQPSLLINPEGQFKKFEENESYEYRIEWSEFKIPDLSQIQGKDEENEGQGQSTAQKIIFENIKKNLEKKIWQLKVIVREADTQFSFDLSTWVLDPKYKMQFSGV